MSIPNRLLNPLRPCLLVLVLALLPATPGDAKESPYIPEVLAPWVEWVLHGKEAETMCTPMYNDAGRYQCDWPSELSLDLTDRGGTFRQTWLVHRDTWAALPGDGRIWPMEVRVDGEARMVLPQGGGPAVRLTPGIHTVSGRFTWPFLPEHLQIPPGTALVSLEVNQAPTPFPNLDSAGRLWLKRAQPEEKSENRLNIDSFRLIDDTIPTRVLLHVTLDAAGSAREVTLGPLFAPDAFIPLSLESPIPARLDPDASLRVRLRPGRFTIQVTLRHQGPLEALSFHHPEDGFWPDEEIWSFRARPDLRLVEIDGAPSIDPARTAMPNGWKRYPAYRLLPGEALRLKQVKRGDPSPAPDQLTLDRSIWLRFDGSGYTIQDQIQGKKNTNWRLEIDPAITLGRVAVDGSEQLITRRRDSDRAGVELRNGVLRLTADSVYQGSVGSLPATGWDHDFQQVRGRLFLPPGWKLFHAAGIDNIPRTWIQRWSLLDFFVVLIFTIALARLYSRSLAAVAFLTLVLTFHEPGAPRYVWLALLVGFALLKYLPEGWFRKLVWFCHGAVVLALVVIAVPYMVQALRVGIYPQLAMPWASMADAPRRQAAAPPAPAADIALEAISESMTGAVRSKEMKTAGRARPEEDASTPYSADGAASQVMQHDPKALTQTGPGVPKWHPFETVPFSWSGPVTRDQEVSFVLVGPGANLVLAVVRVLLIILLALGMFGVRFRPNGGFSILRPAAFLLASALLLFALHPVPSRAAEIPTPEILDALEKRLLEKDPCFPACADIPEIRIVITPERLSLEASVNAQLDAAVPVPGDPRQWMPRAVSIDDVPAAGLLRQNDQLWVRVPAGMHTLRMSGAIRKQSALQLPFPLKPRRATISAEGWRVEGLHRDGSVDAQLQFKRITDKQDAETAEVFETGILPPFVQVERTILLGLVWKVQTEIVRLSPTGSGVVLDIPLLPGESVTTEGIRVVDGAVKINLRADQARLRWESFLAPADSIHLVHQETDAWTEIWRVDVSPIFHMEYEGIPVIHHKAGTRWYPTWHPWPGESVTLAVSRPPGVEGQTLTIDESRLDLRPGRNTTAAALDLSIKSSQGGQHAVLLPEDTVLQEVAIQGKVQSIRQEGRKVTLPITPGSQRIRLQWIESRGMTMRYQSSDVDLGAPSVNAAIQIHLPRSRWPLFVGGEPMAGPAVLFWSVIILIVLAAFGLSRTGWGPLGMRQWFLLGIGLSMSSLAGGILIVAWLVALEFRERWGGLEGRRFNAMQIGVVFLTVAAVIALVGAISNGLLGHPDMNISGNGSSSALLKWYQDVSDDTIPRAWIVSLPMAVYRGAMLAWALWVSFWLVGMLKWGWQRFTRPALWKSPPPRAGRKKGARFGLGRKKGGDDAEAPDPGPSPDPHPEPDPKPGGKPQ